MRIIYTDQSFKSLEESLSFLWKVQGVPLEKVLEIRNQLLDKAESLTTNPHLGQIEEYLEHLEKGHRRLIEGNFKIIYRVESDCVYITDFFDTRQHPEKMKG
ncbi:type II toxin-antitoxin system RelE/ParE family toxin [Algoriphagus mannitolivorans]|uniref:type II toxin-antitoxin system RelE/ParE family toxin n=1 Tax=Algoriphagus mannitolivorans TaxID=226504 RepID=UPI00040D5AB3